MKLRFATAALAVVGIAPPALADDPPAEDDLDVPATTAPSVAPGLVTPTPAPSVTTPAPPPASPPVIEAPRFEIAGYIQAQGQLDQQSQDQLQQGGAQLNQDAFVVRRARISIGRQWETTAFAVELDANTVRGATVGLRRAEATLSWPARDAAHEIPIAALTIGLGDIPFGYELLESSRNRLFMERSTASLAMFPGEPDIGARAWGAWGPFRYAVSLLAGEPVSERAGHNRPDPNQAKDLVARVGAVAAPGPRVAVSGGVSIDLGRGFHVGTDATKDTIEWRDLNENGAIELGELTSVPGVAATPSQNFDRWAVGADVQVGIATCIGWTRVLAEVTVASNLDRGLFVADPIATGGDVRQLGAYLAVLQELGPHAYAAVRLDFYDPNLDALDARGGKLIPVDETITTISPLAGVRLPHGARATIQYDHVIDSLARDARGVPADLANNRVIARLQVEL